MTQPLPKRETSEAILKVSVTLFARQGYDAVSMREIATAVGVRAAALYYHFPDKSSLYLSVMKYAFADGMTAAVQALTEDGPPLVRLKRFVIALIADMTKNPDLLLLIQRERLVDDPDRLKLLMDEVFSKPFSALVDVVRVLAPERDPLMLAVSVAGLVLHHLEGGSIRRFMPGWRPEHEWPETLKQHVLGMLDALFGECKLGMSVDTDANGDSSSSAGG